MKSCLSILIALAIITLFVGAALTLWHGSSSVEIAPGDDFKTPESSSN